MLVARHPNDLVIRPMRPDDLAWAVGLAAEEGWNPGLHDAACFYAADPGGFLVAELEGERIGSVSAVRYDDRFAFLGFYIVLPQYRGAGYGNDIAAACLKLAGDRSYGIDGVVAMQETYQRWGFVPSYMGIRFCRGLGAAAGPSAAALGPGAAAATRAAAPPRPDPVRRSAPPSCAITPVTAAHRDALLAYDRLCFPAERRAFLDCWLAMPGSPALCAQRDGEFCGYGVIRPCVTGYKIGPLFADDALVADDLYAALCAAAPDDGPVYLDVPDSNPQAVALAEALGMSEVFRTVRMYMGPEPAIDHRRVFGVTTFELG